MKRFIVVALMMMAAAGLAFTQSISLSGYFNSGVGAVLTDGDENAQFGAFGVDSEQLGYRFRLNGSVQNEAKTAGFRFRLQSQSTTVERRQNQYLSLPLAYGFMNFFENKLGFSAGIVDDSTWQTADYWINDDVGEGLGLLIKSINLFNGLNLGFGAYLISQEGSSRNNQLSKTLDDKHLLDIADVKYVFSGSYTTADIFYLGASFRMANEAGDNDVENDHGGRQETSQLIGDVRILAVPGLTAVLGFNIDNLQDFSSIGSMVFSETFGYKFNDELNIGLNAVQFVSNKDDTDTSMLFNVWGSYAFGKIVPRLDFTYFLGGESHGTLYHHRRGYNPQYNTDLAVFSIRPSVKLNLDSRTQFEIGNVTHINQNDGNSSILNLIYLDFKWSF